MRFFIKKFYTIIPLQTVYFNEDGSVAKNDLSAGHYEPVGNSKLEYGITRFPVIPLINGYAGPGEEIRVIAITPENPFAEFHLDELRKELETLKAEKGFLCRGVEKVAIAEAGDVGTQIDLFQKLLDYVEDDDMLYGCLTYGNKPMPIAALMAKRAH